MLTWFDTRESVHFARELGQEILSALASSTQANDAKFKVKTEKALVRADAKVREFRRAHRLNFYKKSRMANTFLWTLRDGGCPPEYANELTEWLTFRL